MIFEPEIEFVLVAVGRNGLRQRVGATYNPKEKPLKPGTKWIVPGLVRNMAAGDFSHVEVKTRPRFWAEFSGFATAPVRLKVKPRRHVLPVKRRRGRGRSNTES